MAKRFSSELKAVKNVKIENLEYWVVIYRTGGWANAEWHKTLKVFSSKEEANNFAATIEKQGYKTLVHRQEHLNSFGMPVGYCRHADPISGEMYSKECDCG